MSYIDKATENCINEIKKIMRNTKGNQQEFRIASNKVGSLKLPLMKLYQIAFEQGVYASKSK